MGVPWRADFEEGFCPYTSNQGFCFLTGSARYELVTSPTHSGWHAVAFGVGTQGIDGGSQVRCVRQGILPKAASYSAWYYLPESAETTGNWNLLHFQGGRIGEDVLHNLWDVSLESLPSDAGAELRLVVRDLVNFKNHPIAAQVPLRRWFQLRVDLRRAADPTGVFSFYLDGVRTVHLTDLVTDDSEWGQWYVGNLATDIDPPQSTLYVDDVEIVPLP